MIFQCNHFGIFELVPPELKDSKEANLWMLFPKKNLEVIDALRDDYGKMYINTWSWDGRFSQSGIRLPSSDYYSTTSQHSYANAFDIHPQDEEVEKIRSDIMNRRFDYMEVITGLELNVSWLHIDFRNYDGLFTFSP